MVVDDNQHLSTLIRVTSAHNVIMDGLSMNPKFSTVTAKAIRLKPERWSRFDAKVEEGGNQVLTRGRWLK